mmetsp:Transcript_19148/g.20603  ORF Transcript_19148/g.20603 Transcript_19148/m.20603 type:complete len:84 (-) Transcript_19148:61-312(-)
MNSNDIQIRSRYIKLSKVEGKSESEAKAYRRQVEGTARCGKSKQVKARQVKAKASQIDTRKSRQRTSSSYDNPNVKKATYSTK